MKLYLVECVCGQITGYFGIFDSMNRAITETIQHNANRSNIPHIEKENDCVTIYYEEEEEFGYEEFFISETILNNWEEN